MKIKIAIVGCGNLGQSIAKGILQNQSFNKSDLTMTKRNLDELQSFRSLGASVTSDNTKAVKEAEIVILAVKPYVVFDILEEIQGHLVKGKHTLVSVATGIDIESIKKCIPADIPVIRAMPNTATDVKESLTTLTCSETDKAALSPVKELFDLIGETIIIEEELMEAATILGACGIAYVMRFIRAMIQGGIEIGFDAKTASSIVNQTVKGAAELLIERKEHPEFEIDKVTTPRGCTIVGLNEMEHYGFSSSLIRGIVTSYKKIEK